MWISAVSLTVLLSMLWRTFALWIVPNFICWQELLENSVSHTVAACSAQSLGALCHVAVVRHSHLFHFSALEPLLLLFNYSGTKFGGLVWFDLQVQVLPCKKTWTTEHKLCVYMDCQGIVLLSDVQYRVLRFKNCKKKIGLNVQKEVISIWGLLGSSGLIWAHISETIWWMSIFLLSYGGFSLFKEVSELRTTESFGHLDTMCLYYSLQNSPQTGKATISSRRILINQLVLKVSCSNCWKLTTLTI